MKFAVLGAGFQGTACAYDLARFASNLQEVVLADVDEARAADAAAVVRQMLRKTGDVSADESKIRHQRMDVTHPGGLAAFLRPYNVVISAVPYFLNLAMTRAAIESGTHMVDMGGNTDVVFRQRELSEQARVAGVTVLPDCGLAPGMANILAVDGILRLEKTDRLQIRVGGLPQIPKNALNYQLFFSIHGLINEYLGQATILRDGRLAETPALTGLETLCFKGSDTDLEAFLTLGGLSTLPWKYAGQIREMDYKTIRYPGHCAQIRALHELGLLEEAPVLLNGVPVSPRELFIHQAVPRLTYEDSRDVVLVRVQVEGTDTSGQVRRLVYEVTDRYDETTGLTAMMRCTAFPVSIVAQMLADQRIAVHGVLGLEDVVPTGLFIEELARRNIRLEQYTEAAVS